MEKDPMRETFPQIRMQENDRLSLSQVKFRPRALEPIVDIGGGGAVRYLICINAHGCAAGRIQIRKAVPAFPPKTLGCVARRGPSFATNPDLECDASVMSNSQEIMPTPPCDGKKARPTGRNGWLS